MSFVVPGHDGRSIDPRLDKFWDKELIYDDFLVQIHCMPTNIIFRVSDKTSGEMILDSNYVFGDLQNYFFHGFTGMQTVVHPKSGAELTFWVVVKK